MLLITSLFISIVAIIVTMKFFRRNKSAELLPPMASHHIPIFGSALSYKKDPVSFLIDQEAKLGVVFTLDLAGLKTVIVTSQECQRQFCYAPENVLSSKEAVADFGFRYTLGDYNVFSGTNFHKWVVKNNYSSAAHISAVSKRMLNFISNAVSIELQRCKGGVVQDFFGFIRRIIFISVVSEFLGTTLIQTYNDNGATGSSDFVSEFMQFQDSVEDATAKSAVLPLWLSLPICLWSCARRREVIVSKLENCLKQMWLSDNNHSDEHDEGM